MLGGGGLIAFYCPPMGGGIIPYGGPCIPGGGPLIGAGPLIGMPGAPSVAAAVGTIALAAVAAGPGNPQDLLGLRCGLSGPRGGGRHQCVCPLPRAS